MRSTLPVLVPFDVQFGIDSTDGLRLAPGFVQNFVTGLWLLFAQDVILFGAGSPHGLLKWTCLNHEGTSLGHCFERCSRCSTTAIHSRVPGGGDDDTVVHVTLIHSTVQYTQLTRHDPYLRLLLRDCCVWNIYIYHSRRRKPNVLFIVFGRSECTWEIDRRYCTKFALHMITYGINLVTFFIPECTVL